MSASVRSASSFNLLRHRSPVTSALEMGNPFTDDGKCTYTIDTHNICCDGVIETVSNIETLDRDKFNAFVTDRLQKTLSINY